MSQVLVPLANGCEELEAVTVIDLLRRANISVVVASISSEHLVTASRGVHLYADVLLDEVLDQQFDMLVLPGGLPGADHLNNDPRIHQLINQIDQAGGAVAAICAAPKVLATNGIANGHTISCYPGAIDPAQWPEISFSDNAVTTDKTIITSRGPGTAMDFALCLIGYLSDNNTRKTVESGLVR